MAEFLSAVLERPGRAALPRRPGEWAVVGVYAAVALALAFVYGGYLS